MSSIYNDSYLQPYPTLNRQKVDQNNFLFRPKKFTSSCLSLNPARVKLFRVEKNYFKWTTIACILATIAFTLILIAGHVTPPGLIVLCLALAVFATATIVYLAKQVSAVSLIISLKFTVMLLFAPIFALLNTALLIKGQKEQRIESIL